MEFVNEMQILSWTIGFTNIVWSRLNNLNCTTLSPPLTRWLEKLIYIITIIESKHTRFDKLLFYIFNIHCCECHRQRPQCIELYENYSHLRHISWFFSAAKAKRMLGCIFELLFYARRLYHTYINEKIVIHLTQKFSLDGRH